jgi:hypothetical protein
MSENLDFVRSILADWERGDFSRVDWAPPEIEFVLVDGPEPGRTASSAGLAGYWRDFLVGWRDFRVSAEDCRELADGRVLALLRLSGRGKTSGLALERAATAIFGLREGKTCEIVYYNERDRALADLGLED